MAKPEGEDMASDIMVLVDSEGDSTRKAQVLEEGGGRSWVGGQQPVSIGPAV